MLTDNKFVRLYPELAKEWDYKENNGIDISTITYGSSKPIHWVCAKGHKWVLPVKKRTLRGDGCPYCSGKKSIVGENDFATLFPDIASQWDYEKNIYSPTDYLPKSNQLIYWICENGHSYQSKICERTRGRSCPYCAHKRVVYGETDLKTKFPDIAAMWDCNKNGKYTPENVSYGSNKRVWWICENNHEWEDTVKNCVKRGNCPYCVADNRLSVIAPELYEEIHPTKNTIIKDITIQSNRNIWWICNKGHEWQSPVYCRFRGDKCPYCSGKRPIVGETDLKTVNPELCKEWNYKKNRGKRPENYTRFSNARVWWICENGHEWRATICHRSAGTGCPECRKERL